MSSWNHVGLAVADLDRSIRFYGEVFGFVEVHRLQIPDGVASRAAAGAGSRSGSMAVYLRLGSTVLELLHFDRAWTVASPPRYHQPGLTHVSFTVDDVAGGVCQGGRSW